MNSLVAEVRAECSKSCPQQNFLQPVIDDHMPQVSPSIRRKFDSDLVRMWTDSISTGRQRQEIHTLHETLLPLQKMRQELASLKHLTDHASSQVITSCGMSTDTDQLQRDYHSLWELFQREHNQLNLISESILSAEQATNIRYKQIKAVPLPILKHLAQVIKTLGEKFLLQIQADQLHFQLTEKICKLIQTLHQRKSTSGDLLEEMIFLISEEARRQPLHLGLMSLPLDIDAFATLTPCPEHLVYDVCHQGILTARLLARILNVTEHYREHGKPLIAAGLLQNIGLTTGWGIGQTMPATANQPEHYLWIHEHHAELGAALVSGVYHWSTLLRTLVRQHEQPMLSMINEYPARFLTSKQIQNTLNITANCMEMVRGQRQNILQLKAGHQSVITTFEIVQILQLEIEHDPASAPMKKLLLSVLMNSDEWLLESQIEKLLPQHASVHLSSQNGRLDPAQNLAGPYVPHATQAHPISTPHMMSSSPHSYPPRSKPH
jgi:hypothetical protein